MADPALVEQWFALTRTVMPAQAKERGWPVRFDHCFQRILLDNAVGAKWTTAIAAPAYRNASDAVLARAIALGRNVIAQEADLHVLNQRSLAWRGKLREPVASSSGAGRRWLPEFEGLTGIRPSQMTPRPPPQNRHPSQPD